MLRGLLLTGGGARRLRHDPARGSQIAAEPLWWPPGKIAGTHLPPYLAAHPDLGLPADGVPVPA